MQSNSLHLLRALLRECTYLPDPAARTFWHHHLLHRFRAYCPRETDAPWKKPKVKLVDTKRQTYLAYQARKTISLLARANAGHPKILDKVLAYTYGRLGRRRHELIAGLLLPDVPNDHTAVARLADQSTGTTDDGIVQPTAKLLALIKSQRAHRRFGSIKTPPAIPLEIPGLNSWGRPLPVKRVKNLKKRWYAKILETVLPPLPRQEWERLRDLALGDIPWPGPITRRGALPRSERINHSNPHRLTPRYMRRTWARVFAQCPVMAQDEKSGRWLIEWGKVEQIVGDSSYLRTEDRDVFFADIDYDEGQLEPSQCADD